MMREPWFWRDRSLAARAIAASLAPGAALYDATRRIIVARARAQAPPVPVFCVGNAVVGGVGKTPFALLLGRLLMREGLRPCFQTRGYGGALQGPARVDPSVHGAADVGDEALLLAALAPTFVARDRPAGVRAAAREGADAVVMDDGFQNPSVVKTLSFLLLDDQSAGNGRLFPAGPLRERVAEAEARADAVVHVGPARETPSGDDGRPRFSAWLEPVAPEKGRVFAFCGIARPERFFASLEGAGVEVAGRRSFPDHHPYTEHDLGTLRASAAACGAPLVTTEKDFVRIPPERRAGLKTFEVAMRVSDDARLIGLLRDAIRSFRRRDE
jgi:tetraacyldisaccharide 4'-kinase